jgi:hypothetical protein
MIGLTGWRDEKIKELNRKIDLLEHFNLEYERAIVSLQSKIDEYSIDDHNAKITSDIIQSASGISAEDAAILMGVVRSADKRREDSIIKRAMGIAYPIL